MIHSYQIERVCARFELESDEFYTREEKAARMIRSGEASAPRLQLRKVAWVRLDFPAGYSAPGRLNCPCGEAPLSMYEPGPDLTCACGTVYSWDGWIR